MNPWVIVGLLAALIVAVLYGMELGEDRANARWLVKENKEVAAANDKIRALLTERREKEAAHTKAMFSVDAKYQGERDVLKNETNRLRAAIRDGSLRLRNHTRGESPSGGAPSEALASACQRDGEAATQLSAAASEFLVELTGEADEIVKQLTACQEVIEADRKGQ